MSIILLSRLSDSSGRAVARDLAAKLDYECLDEEVFQEASAASGLPVGQIKRALSEPPTLFGMRAASRRRCLIHFKAALAEHLLRDRVVYHGPFGCWIVSGVSHALTARIHASLDDRVAVRSSRDGSSPDEARRAIQREDRGRLALARELFSGDDDDVGRFDLILNTSQVDPGSAVDVIAETVGLRRFQPMTYSVGCLQDLALARRLEARLVDLDPRVEVSADAGQVRIRTQLSGGLAKRRFAEIERRALALEGVSAVQIQNVGDLFSAIAGRLR